MAAAHAGPLTVAYVSSAESGEISVLRLDAARGELALVQAVPVGGQVMPMALSPRRTHLYAALRSRPWTVVTLRIAPSDGRLDEVGRSPLPDSMAYLAVDRAGRTLLAASYGGDTMSVSPIDAGGVAGEAAQVLPTGRNAHAVLADPANRRVYLTTLGAGQVMQFGFDAQRGRVAPDAVQAYAARPGAGPRHFVFHPDGRFVYLLNELDASIDVLALDARDGMLSLVQTLDALPAGFTGKPWAADLHLTPDGRFLYTSERTSSTLAGFRVDEATGRLAPLGHTLTEMQPRGFGIDPSGRCLLAVGQLSHAGTLYAIDPQSGALRALQRLALGRDPNWVEIVALP